MSVRNLTFINGKAPSGIGCNGHRRRPCPEIGGVKWKSSVAHSRTNTGRSRRGAVAVWTGSSLTIASSRFTSNTSWYGGAVYSLLSPLTVVNSEFTKQYYGSAKVGMATAEPLEPTVRPSQPPIQSAARFRSVARRSAAARAMEAVAAAYIWMYPPDQVIIDRSTIESNNVVKNADSQGAIGGAMRISNGAITIKDSSFLSKHQHRQRRRASTSTARPPATSPTPRSTATRTQRVGAGDLSGTSSGQISMDNVTFFASNNQQNTSGNCHLRQRHVGDQTTVSSTTTVARQGHGCSRG